MSFEENDTPPSSLFAVCKVDSGLICKRVRLTADVQRDVTGLFRDQDIAFHRNVDYESPFDGAWNAGEDELLTSEVPPSAQPIVDAAHANAISTEVLDTHAFSHEGIKALFLVVRNDDDALRILIQKFTAQQLLYRKFVLTLDLSNTFNRLSEPAFTLDTSLACIIENGKIKFKSLQKLRSIIDIAEIYREATDVEVRTFALHRKFHVGNVDRFVDDADLVIRRLISGIVADRILDRSDLATIEDAARETRLPIAIENGKIVMPKQKKEVKELLTFLNESRYNGPLSGTPYVTNSRRRA